jgi:FG-GAP repeat
MPQRSSARKSIAAKVVSRGVGAIGAAGVLVLLVAFVPATAASASTSAQLQNAPRGALLASLSDPGATACDYFGYSVAVSGTTAVVGDPLYNSDEGGAYI